MLSVNAPNKHVGFFIPAAEFFDPFVVAELADDKDCHSYWHSTHYHWYNEHYRPRWQTGLWDNFWIWGLKKKIIEVYGHV